MGAKHQDELKSMEIEGGANAQVLMICPEEHDLGGFTVRRALPDGRKPMIGPWIFFDHIGPAIFPPGKGVDVRPHPHINLATVTYLFTGEMLHRDSLGNEIIIRPGEINLMVAGKGIVHSERQRDEIKANGHQLHGLQFWLALPEVDEEMEPAFFHYSSASIPQIEINSVPVRVLIGTAYNVQSPVKTFSDTLCIEASLKAGQSLELPEGIDELGLYVIEGKLTFKEKNLDQYSMAVLQSVTRINVTAVTDTRLAIIGGERLSTRHIWWNFVSSRKERIEQAKQDWKVGNFPKVPGDEIEFIPLPEE